MSKPSVRSSSCGANKRNKPAGHDAYICTSCGGTGTIRTHYRSGYGTYRCNCAFCHGKGNRYERIFGEPAFNAGDLAHAMLGGNRLPQRGRI